MIKLSDPRLPEAAISRAVDVLRAGNLIQGKEVESFEDSIRQYIDVKHAVVVSSGTAALHLALLSLGIGPGDEVIVPAFSFAATANVVERVGATPVFVDISPDDFCIDTSQIEQAISIRTRCIMPVHEFGQPVEWEELRRISLKYSLPVIEDAACALGASYGGVKCGALGKIGCFSLHPRKAITTGEGGVLTTNDDVLATKLRRLRNHGIERSPERIDFVIAGLNYRLTEFQAAIGVCQMSLLEEYILKRQTLASVYDEILGNSKHLRIPSQFQIRRMVYQTYHVVLNEEEDRTRIISALRNRGIESSVGAQAIHALTYYQEKYSLPNSEYPNAYRAYTHGLALPMGHHLDSSDVVTVANSLLEVLE